MGAAAVFGQIKDALNTIWNVEPNKSAGVKGFLKDRFLSLAMVLGIGFLLLVTLVFDAMISAMGDHVAGRFPDGKALLQARRGVHTGVRPLGGKLEGRSVMSPSSGL